MLDKRNCCLAVRNELRGYRPARRKAAQSRLLLEEKLSKISDF